MTIIKVSKDGKKLIKKKDETVVPLHASEAAEPGQYLHVDVMPSDRSKRIVNIFLLIIALLVLSAGMVGGVYLYKYMAHRHKVSHVTIQYMDEQMPTPLPSHGSQAQRQPLQPYSYVFEEEIDVMLADEVERIDVPKFDDCRSSVVIHDFHTNMSVIVDKSDNECFLMDLDRNQMSPPRTFAELISKYASGYYMPKASVVRRNYHIVTPPITDLTFAGNYIKQECIGFTSYKLEKNRPQPMIEIEFLDTKAFKTFGFSNLREVIKEQIFK